MIVAAHHVAVPSNFVLINLFLHIFPQREQVHVARIALIPHRGDTNLGKDISWRATKQHDGHYIVSVVGITSNLEKVAVQLMVDTGC